jgi:hypothetical protein
LTFLPNHVNWTRFWEDIFVGTVDGPVSHTLSMKDLQRAEAGSSLGGHTMKVAKFVANMQGKKADSMVSSKSLDDRSTALVGPQETTPAPAQGIGADAGPEAVALENELQILADEIEAGKSKISIGAKFLTRIKSLFPRSDSYDTAIAKQVFSKIASQETKYTLLNLAFQAAAAPENRGSMQDNVKVLSKFCQAAEVNANKVMEAIHAISDLGIRGNVLKELSGSGFKWDGLSALGATEAKELVLELAGDRSKGVDCLWELSGTSYLTALKNLEATEAKEFVLGLASRQGGAECLWQLLNMKYLKNLDTSDAKELVLGLANAGEQGVDCLRSLCNKGTLDLSALTTLDTSDAKELALGLANAGEKGAAYLLQLFEADTLQNLNLDANDSKEIALNLAKTGPIGAACLLQLLRTANLDLTALKNLEATKTKELVLGLANAGKKGVGCLRSLCDKGNLDLAVLNTLDATAVKDLVLGLANAGEKGVSYLGQLLNANYLAVLNTLDATAVKDLAKKLVKTRPVGAACLRQLLNAGKLQNLQLKGVASENVKGKALELLGQGQQGVKQLRAMISSS